MKEPKWTAAKVYMQSRNGDPISDIDLDVAIRELTPVVELLSELGPRFEFMWFDLFQSLEKFKSYKYYRNNK